MIGNVTPTGDLPKAEPWLRLEADEVLRRLGTDPKAGLPAEEADRRFLADGPNDLIEVEGRTLLTILWEQLRGPLVILLVVAAGISWSLGEHRDAIAVLVIVVLNAVLGVSQEARAEGAMAALRQLEVPLAKVWRGGRLLHLPARELVRGDLVGIEAGDRVPADARLAQGADLRLLESALTGESEAVSKDPAPLPSDDLPLGDRTNMVYVGTVVTHGHGLAVVTAIGMATELGHIADMLQGVDREPTPLQRRLARLAKNLAIAALVVVALVVFLGWLRGEDLRLLLMTALSLAVAAVPEGLPAVATVALAIGSRRMLARQALIRRLPAVETLGSVTVICSDKTGTLTRNRMALAAVETATESLETASLSPRTVEPGDIGLALLLDIATLCNDAVVGDECEGEDSTVLGDPTEVALVEGAARFEVDKASTEQRMPRIGEAPFDAQRKRMATVHRLAPEGGGTSELWQDATDGAGHLVASKGGADALLAVADRVWVGNRAVPVDEGWRERLQSKHDRLASGGMRVLGFAFRPLPEAPADIDAAALERALIFVGMAGLIDPPRRGARESVARCRSAGIRPVMITGDHPVTALAIARQLGIAGEGQLVSGQELEAMSDQELAAKISAVEIFARVTPGHKLRIVNALQDQGQVVAMTGDGVNDAPALRQADIGLAMGITGTDVAKEAAEIVLLDDRFATLVDAVEEGRTAYDNIRKFIKYALASNVGEISVMLLGPFFGLPLPLLPLQILWINLVTDGLPGLALSLEPAEPDTMSRPPYPPGEGVFARGLGRDILWVGLLGALTTLVAGSYYWNAPEPLHSKWQTVVFTVLTLSQMGNVLAMRARRESFFSRHTLDNRPLLGAVGLTLALQVAALYLPVFQATLGTRPLDLRDLLFCFAFSTVTFFAVEAQKWWRRRREDGGTKAAA